MLTRLALWSVVLAVFPGTAAAEWHITPLIGVTFARNSPPPPLDLDVVTKKAYRHYGGAVARLGEGVLGAEVVLIWTPGLYQGGQLDIVEKSRAISLMGNVVLTTPRRWTEYSLRPFVSGGLGLVHARTQSTPELFLLNANLAGFNIGGGAIGFLSERTGLRFDLRYHSSFRKSANAEEPGVRLRYMTASIGLVFRR